MSKLQELHEKLQALENNNDMDYLEKMRSMFHIKEQIAEEEMKELLKEMADFLKEFEDKSTDN